MTSCNDRFSEFSKLYLIQLQLGGGTHLLRRCRAVANREPCLLPTEPLDMVQELWHLPKIEEGAPGIEMTTYNLAAEILIFSPRKIEKGC